MNLNTCKNNCIHYPVCKYVEKYSDVLNVADYCEYFLAERDMSNPMPSKTNGEKNADNMSTNKSNNKPLVYLYTDGACSGNPGPGGWGAILKADGMPTKKMSGGAPHTTNNRMEVTAAIKGLEAIKVPAKVILTSDSTYLVNSVTKGWVYNWRDKGWIKNGAPVPNADLWKDLLILLERHDVEFKWVRGHHGHPENEECDKLATSFIKAQF